MPIFVTGKKNMLHGIAGVAAVTLVVMTLAGCASEPKPEPQ